MLKVVHDTETVNENTTGESLLDAIARDGAQQMLAVALQAEVDAYIDAHRADVDENGHRLVVRNGHGYVNSIRPRDDGPTWPQLTRDQQHRAFRGCPLRGWCP